MSLAHVRHHTQIAWSALPRQKNSSELRNAAHLPYLSRQGIAEALAHKVHEVIYNAGLSGGAWPQPVSVDTLQACYPGLSDLLREETLRREAENRRKELERIEAAKPINRLGQAYFNYMVVKRCYDVRLGYQLVYINEVELERAKEAVASLKPRPSRQIHQSIQATHGRKAYE